MAKTKEISSSLRERVIGLILGKHGIREISLLLSIPPSTVSYTVA